MTTFFCGTNLLCRLVLEYPERALLPIHEASNEDTCMASITPEQLFDFLTHCRVVLPIAFTSLALLSISLLSLHHLGSSEIPFPYLLE
jgi:hypothetical protein